MIKNITQKNEITPDSVRNVTLGGTFVTEGDGLLYVRLSMVADTARGGYKCFRFSEGFDSRIVYVSANAEISIVDINIEWERKCQ